MRRAGLLDERIVIKRPTLVTNEYGEKVETLEVVTCTRANVIDDNGNRGLVNNEIFYSYSKTFQVRHYIDVQDEDIIEWQGREYRIISVEHRRKEVDIMVKTELINK